MNEIVLALLVTVEIVGITLGFITKNYAASSWALTSAILTMYIAIN